MNLNDLYPVVLSILLIGVLLGVGLVILGTLQTNAAITSVTVATQAINLTTIALGTFSTWMGIIVLVIAAAVVIGLVINSFIQLDL